MVFLKMKLTVGAGVFTAVDLAVSAFLFPTGLGAGCQLGAVHASRTAVHLPAGIEMQVVAYCRQVEVLGNELLNEVQAFEVGLGVKAATATTPWTNNPLPLPDADCLGVDADNFGDNAYGKRWQVFHAV